MEIWVTRIDDVLTPFKFEPLDGGLSTVENVSQLSHLDG